MVDVFRLKPAPGHTITKTHLDRPLFEPFEVMVPGTGRVAAREVRTLIGAAAPYQGRQHPGILLVDKRDDGSVHEGLFYAFRSAAQARDLARRFEKIADRLDNEDWAI